MEALYDARLANQPLQREAGVAALNGKAFDGQAVDHE